MDSVQIIPHGPKSGTDIVGHTLGPGNECRPYVVRSDLGYYLVPPSEHQKKHEAHGPSEHQKKYEAHGIHSSFSDGEHYFGAKAQYYVIKGSMCSITGTLSADVGTRTFQLAYKCQGGDHYCGLPTQGYAIIMKDKVITVEDLESAKGFKEFNLHDDYKDGIYFWCSGPLKGSGPPTYFVAKQISTWGLQYVTTHDLSKPKETIVSFPEDVIEFLPGGIAFLLGPVSAGWVLLDSIDNKEGDVDLSYKRKAKLRVSYLDSISKSLEQNYELSLESLTNVTPNILGYKLIQAQARFAKVNGGIDIDTKTEEWKKERSVTKAISEKVPPGKVMYIWQYKFNLGEETLLSSSHWKGTKGEMPTEIPDIVKFL